MTDFDPNERRIRETVVMNIIPLPEKRDAWRVDASVEHDGKEYRDVTGPHPAVAVATPMARYTYDRETERRVTREGKYTSASFCPDTERFPFCDESDPFQFATTYFLLLLPADQRDDGGGWTEVKNIAWSADEAEKLVNTRIAEGRERYKRACAQKENES